MAKIVENEMKTLTIVSGTDANCGKTTIARAVIDDKGLYVRDDIHGYFNLIQSALDEGRNIALECRKITSVTHDVIYEAQENGYKVVSYQCCVVG